MTSRLAASLAQDLDFQQQETGYASHNFHPFPAKFPPQLPRLFIESLTEPGDVVLDPMMGSTTTVLEAYLAGRKGIGIDIDPLALLISLVKVTTFFAGHLKYEGDRIIKQAALALKENRVALEEALEKRWDRKTREFVDYWFLPDTQLELLALANEIDRTSDPLVRAFSKLAFSATIITKSGGVSLALDLAHTRPHRVRLAVNEDGKVIFGDTSNDAAAQRKRVSSKTIRSPIREFGKRFLQNVKGALAPQAGRPQPSVLLGDAQNVPIRDSSVDLIVTSPPYAANAIDYMRAHKFSLVWWHNSIGALSRKRNTYIGGESVHGFNFEELPDFTAKVLSDVSACDAEKGRSLSRYYSEMTRCLREMFRVLKAGRVAVVVVGSSVMRGRDTETARCLTEIGTQIGFQVPGVSVRSISRDRRMMPAGSELDLHSQIQQRMHEEYVIGFYKP